MNSRLGTSNYEIIKRESDLDGICMDSEFDALEEVVNALDAFAAELASEGAVLLKNENKLLPIDKGEERATLWGLSTPRSPAPGSLAGSSVALDPTAGQAPWVWKRRWPRRASR